MVSVSTKIQRRGVFSFFSSVHVGVGYNGRQKNKSNQKNKSIQQMDCGTLNSYPTFAEQAIGFFAMNVPYYSNYISRKAHNPTYMTFTFFKKM